MKQSKILQLTPLLAVLLWLIADGLAAEPVINNAALMPTYKPDAEVQMEGMSPDWVKSLIMVNFPIEAATPEGTFAAATKVLDHYAEMGVNGLWINPIWARIPKNRTSNYFNGYGNFGHHLIAPELTGTDDQDLAMEEVRRFVAEAHKRNIRVVFDVVVWGVEKESPLVKEHPEFFRFPPDGKFSEQWGGLWLQLGVSGAARLVYRNSSEFHPQDRCGRLPRRFGPRYLRV